MTNRSKPKKKRISRYVILMTTIGILLVGGGIFVIHRIWLSDNTPNSKKNIPRPITSKGESSSTQPATSNGKPTASTVDNTSTPVANPNNITPIKPYGSFVSNHRPGENGSPTNEESLCNTTPSASCTITFTKDGVTKKLATKTADSAGAVYWSWTPASIGLTEGNWTVTALAIWGQQSASTLDPNPLAVKQ